MLAHFSASALTGVVVSMLLLVAPQQAHASTLEAAVNAALSRAGTLDNSEQMDPSDWLSGVPSLSLSHVESDQVLGTDETEVILNFPIKGAQWRRLDDTLARLDSQQTRSSAVYRRWLYTGRVREAAWAVELADIDVQGALAELALLTSLQQQHQSLADAGVLPLYTALITQRALIKAELTLDEARQAKNTALQAFTLLTGMGSVPSNLTESQPVPTEPDWQAHPALKQLQLAREQQEALLALSSPTTTSWNLSLLARNFESPGFSEAQYGLAVQAPLTMFERPSRANQSERRSAARDYLLQKDQVWLELNDQWQALDQEATRLAHRQELLQQAVALGDDIQTQIEALNVSNEIDSEIHLKRLVDIQQTRTELKRTSALMGRNQARRLQAAGRSL